MTNEDRVLYELRFSYQGLSDEEGDFYIDLIRHIKEVTDSEVNIDGSKSTTYDLVTMSLRRLENGEVSFNGAIANEYENKWIEGIIKRNGNKAYVDSNITQLHESIKDKKPYNSFDYFNFKRSNAVVRQTSYSNGKHFEAILEPFSKESRDAYLQDKVDSMKTIKK